MDILEIFDEENPCEMELMHPTTGEGTGIILHVYSASNPKVKKVVQANEDKNRKRMARGKIISSNVEEAQSFASISACIASWDWSNAKFDLDGNKNPEFTDTNKKRLLSVGDFIVQVSEVSANMENFTSKPKKELKNTSATT